MSHHVEQPWIERNWQVFVIAFAVVCVVILALYNPVI
jgi:uncharacterized membrane protein